MASSYLDTLKALHASAVRLQKLVADGDIGAIQTESERNRLLFQEYTRHSASGLSGAERSEARHLCEQLIDIQNQLATSLRPWVQDMQQLVGTFHRES